MRSPLVRLGAVTIGVLSLLGVATPPAHATTATVVAFEGDMLLSAPIGLPCVAGRQHPNKFPSLDVPGTGKCNILAWTTLKGPGTDLPASQLSLPNRRTFSFTTVPCLDVTVNALKLSPVATHAGPCRLGATGYVKGFCGLSQGHGSASFTDALGAMRTISFTFTGVAGVLVVSGTTAGGGTFVGAVQTLLPTPALTPGQSCLSKSAIRFKIAGGGVFLDIT